MYNIKISYKGFPSWRYTSNSRTHEPISKGLFIATKILEKNQKQENIKHPQTHLQKTKPSSGAGGRVCLYFKIILTSEVGRLGSPKNN